jgi:hypothetical protein
MLIAAIMTIYQVATYEHCFEYDLVSFLFSFSNGAVALCGTVSFSDILFYEFSSVSMFSCR